MRTTTPTQSRTGDRRRRALTALSWFMAAEFVIGGAAKFLPGETFLGPPYAERFVDWGYPSWFRFLVGAGELAGAALLLAPRRRFLGAAVLLAILVGAVATHVVNQDPLSESVSAPVHLALASTVAWATRPAGWSEMVDRRRAAARAPLADPSPDVPV